MVRRVRERYDLRHLIGRGGMGEVWAAHDLDLGRPVAVKFLAPLGHRGDLAALEQRFLREAKLTARIGHPGVPVVHDTGRLEDNRLYLVMEFVNGRTLSALLRERGPFPVRQAAAVAAQTADVLAHADRIRVVHRDLKPSNLMLTPNGSVKVLDFGIAAALEPGPDDPRLTATDDVLGTPGFISPEQANGQRATTRSDLYALGCVLYEILAGEPPFAADTPRMALLFKHAYEQPPPLAGRRAGLPPDLADLVMRLLAKAPDARPSANEVRDLGRRCEAQSAAAGPGGGAVPAVPPRRAGGSVPAPSRGEPPRGPRPASAAEQTPAPASDLPLMSPDLAGRIRRLHDRGEFGEAAALLEQELRESSRPLDDAGAVPARLTLYEYLWRAEDFTRAHEGYSALGDVLRRTRSATDREVLACRRGAARCLAELGRTGEALREFESLLPVEQHVFGPLATEVLDTRLSLASLVARSGRHREAREQLAALREDLRRALPGDDPRHAVTADLIERLDRLLDSAKTTP